ncbi:probable serine/threonine-protein kinase DDB_G0282963 isoform X2 [Sitodiplosis mosellana]|uniref:probable serine/threonine-protein kinase DDB_G0282963 isoform X2 n=2 Tax=Sitodiplosis mosellana TaxID=263140 RepID=UPI002444C472|nr:probable serine/threonine-protein kinase DDB_G0282963 isoform X2 [Sitodiplosis mosellana]
MHSHCKPNKHFSPSNKNTDNNHNNNCSLFNNLNIMDRSVDSIGSCSLDVDAESTDFSDTSGSLNVCTPSSGKDFTREFTSRIHERCQFPNHPLSGQKLQQTKTVLDPNSGKISTILSPQNVPPTVNSPTTPVKKPSYLNLACCVNGYSNLTTYDSKFRQSINKSREVSPIRPITYAVQYNRNGGSDNNYLSVPVPVPINDNNTITNTTNTNKINFMMDAHSILAPEKRYFSTTTQQKTIEINGTSHDVTDNVNSNGCAKFYTRSMLQHTTTPTTTNGTGNTSLALVRDVNQEFDANGKGTAKSFIQQRVERLYGPGAVTQGLYSPKKPKSDDNQETTTTRTTQISTVLVEKSQNTTFQSTKYVLEAQRNGHLNGLSNNRAVHDDENINLDSINEALPVLRHLRPEFRAQLPTLSPKRTIAISKLTPTAAAAAAAAAAASSSSSVVATQTTSPQTQQSQYTNGGTAVNGKLNISTNILNNVNKQVLNGGVVSSTPSPNIIDNDNENVVDNNDDVDDDDDSNRSTLDMQSHKQSLLASNAPTNTTTKNGCLTSNKSHDIEIVDSSQNESTTKGSNIVATTHLNTQNTSNLLPANVDKPNDINKMASEISDFLIESPSSPQNPVKIQSIDQSSIGDASNDGNDTMKLAVNNTTVTSVEAMDANGNHKTDQKKDGLYFLHVVQSERDRLINMAIAAEKELDELLQKGGVDEEILGHLRSAAGKARLLATKKFKQFEGLCNDNINQITRDMPPPTTADLQGFWEMVCLQVENVDSLYVELDKMRANGWEKLTQVKPKQPQGSKLTKRPVAGAKSSTSSAATTTASGSIKKSVADAKREAAAQKREAQRKQLAEMRRKNKLAMTTAVNVPNSSENIIVDQVIEDTPSRQSNNEENNTENETDR